MKSFIYILSSFLFLMSSCIKDEPLYKEADIESFSLNDELMIYSIVSQSSILVVVLDTTNIGSRKFTPNLTLSPKATIYPSPENGIQFVDYKATFNVTSEDGTVSKSYTIEVSQISMLKFDFERWTTSGWKKYPVLEDISWSNANPGLAIAAQDGYVYPTRPTEKGGGYNSDYAALLETKEGVKLLEMGANIIAGSLFRGDFVLSTPVAESAKFGHIHPESAGKPLKMTGYYKYSPGPVCIDKENNVLDKTDQCSIYAVLFKVTKGDEGRSEFLTSSVIETSDKIVARARVEDGSAKTEFTFFSVDFVYTEELDYSINDYKLTIVFSSSRYGDLEEGAIGSCLIVDDVEIVTDNTD